MINSLSIEIYCRNIVYIYIYKVQLIPYFICYHNSCLYFSMHSFHLPNII